MSVFGVFLVRIYAHLDWIRRFTLQISVFSPSAVKCGPEKLRIRTLFTQCNPLLPDLFTRTRMVHTNKDERQNPPVPTLCLSPLNYDGTLFLKYHLLVGLENFSFQWRITLNVALGWFFACRRGNFGEELVIQLQIFSQKVLFFSVFMSISCLKWFLTLIVNLINCFYSIELGNKDLLQNLKTKYCRYKFSFF